jgi:hypothetical protein
MNRRAFIRLVGGAAAWPLAARGQQSAMPVIGFLHTRSQEAYPGYAAFLKGLEQTGFVDGRASGSNIVGLAATTIGFRQWQTIWSADK